MTCNQTLTLRVTSCGAGTDWVNNPGSCRIRIKNYVDGLLPGCVVCNVSGAPAWDGTFSEVVSPGVFAADTSTAKSISGKVFAGATLTWTGLKWTFNITCLQGGVGTGMWQASVLGSPTPFGVYNFGGGCSGGPLTLELEAY